MNMMAVKGIILHAINMKRASFLFFALLVPFFVSAKVEINEIMYDVEGADDGREWVEVFNSNSEAVDLLDWRIYEAATNHKINLFGKGVNFIIPSMGYAIIADNPDKFLLDNSSFSGAVFDSSFSLNNAGEKIILKDGNLNEIDDVFYSSDWGAAGDGNSLQKINGNWKTASSTPGAQNNNSSNSIVVEEQQNQVQQIQNQNQQTQFYYGTPSPVIEKRIKVFAGDNKLGVAGADIEFLGKAWGLKDEPLNSARFIWNFGDGSSKEGRIVNHNYAFPGDYIAVLDIAEGEYAASSKVNVKVLANEVALSEVNSNDSWVELYNGSREIIDISFWQVSYENQNFIFPKNTFIRGKNFLVLPPQISGFNFKNEKGEIRFLYPNGFLAQKFYFEGNVSKNETYSLIGENIFLSLKTPGDQNKVIENLSIASADKIKNNLKKDASELARNLFIKPKRGANVLASSGEIKNTTVIPSFTERKEEETDKVTKENTKELPIVIDGNNKAEAFSAGRNFFKTTKWLFAVLTVSVLSGAAFFVFRSRAD